MLIALLLLPVAAAYVQLLYPPARDLYSINTLKSSQPPCGESNLKNGFPTWLKSGQQLNVSWFLSTPHQGGYKIEVLSETNEVVALLTPLTTYLNTDDPNRRSQTVIIPSGLKCFNCSIRLVRQAREFGKSYKFYSCADVNIVEEITDGDTCSGHGTRRNSTCECNPFFSGSDCQSKDECWDDEDCGKAGICKSVNKYIDPKKQCFCQNGHFGEQCELETRSFTDETNFDSSLYKSLEIGGDEDKIYWRILQDEIEFVLKFKGKSWAAIGWKSQSADNKCLALNGYENDRNESSNNSKTEEIISKQDSISPSLQPVGTENKETAVPAKETCSDDEVFSNCPDFTRQCEASCDWTSFPETIPDCPRTCGSPKCVCKEGYVRVSNNNDSCVPFSFCSNQVEVECPANATWAKCGVACEPTCENMYDTSPCEATCDVPACTCADNYVRYKGECIFWGDCPNLEDHWAAEVVTQATVTEVTVEETKATTTTIRETQALVEELICGINETINECGRICESDCVSVFLRESCSLCAKPACSCIEGYARHNNKCIYWGDCPLNVKALRPDDKALTQRNNSEVVMLDESLMPASGAVTTEVPMKNQSSEGIPLENNGSIESKKSLESSPQISLSDHDEIKNILDKNTNNKDDDISDPTQQPDNGENSRLSESAEAKTTNASVVKAAQYLQASKDHSANSTVSRNSGTDEKETDVIGDVCYGDWRWPPGCRDCDYRISWNYLDETDEIEFSIETRAPSNWWTGVGFSPTGAMAEADMIIVKSRNGHLTLHDMYATGYGVPREDTEQNVYTPTIVGTHVNGVLRAQFTRKRDTGDRTFDHRFSDNECYRFLFPVSGGRIDENGHLTQHLSNPHVSENKICIRSCTSPQSLQPSSSCETEFRYPAGCEGAACDYVAKWEYSMSRKDVKFEISAKELGRWVGIGFSRDGAMANSDIYTGWVYEGKAYVTDRFAYGRQLPAIDPADRQDIYEVNGKLEDDIQTISFRRKIITADTVTDFPLNKCYYFLFPIGGGRVLARKTHDFQNPKTPIGYHDLYQPRVSRTKICICDKNGVPVASEDAPRAVRLRRQAQDPFDIQVDPFLAPVITSEPVTLLPAPSNISISALQETKELLNPFNTPESKTFSPAIVDEVASDDVSFPETNHSLLMNHPMDCADFVISSVSEGVFRIRDYFATSRSTPQLDSLYGGKDSVTSAAAYQRNGITTVVFRKPLHAQDPADSSIVKGPMTLLWAKGALIDPSEEGAVFKDEVGANGNFYLGDLIKYDGKKNGGFMTVDFFAEENKKIEDAPNTCSGSFSYPINCYGSECQYSISWKSNGEKVDFVLEADLEIEHWTGIGYSSDGSMAKSDIIGVSIPKDSVVRVLDYYSPGYGRPKLDEDQGVFAVHANYESKRVFANFSRKLASTDQQDLSLEQCVYFIFPATGGPLEEGSGDIKKHFEPPISSTKKVCLNTCAIEEPPNEVVEETTTKKPPLKAAVIPSEPTEPPKATYNVVLRIMNREWEPKLANASSTEFREMSNVVTNAVNSVLMSKWPDLKVSKIVKFSKGNVLTQLLLTTDEEDSPSASNLKSVLEEYALRGPIESLQIEATTIKVSKEKHDGKAVNSDELRNWVVIAIGVVLTLLATCLICSIFHRSRKARSNMKYSPYPVPCPMNGYDYQATMPPTMEKKGFENAAFQTSLHARQFSQATTASQNGKNSPNSTQESPKGVGETTYQEWFTKVASKPSSQHHQESTMSSPGRPSPSRQPYAGSPYVSYPNDSINFYTLNGEHRVAPPRYLRPF